MKITYENYEAFLLDFLEGRLTEPEKAELDAFLKANPNLKELLEQYSSIKAEPESLLFVEKTNLYKYKFDETLINKNNYNDFCIAYYENLLNTSKRTELLNFVEKNPALKNDFLLYKKTYLKPEVVVFNEKTILYRNPSKKLIYLNTYFWTSIAAGLALLLGLYFNNNVKLNKVNVFISSDTKKEYPQLVNSKPITLKVQNIEKKLAVNSIHAIQSSLFNNTTINPRVADDVILPIQRLNPKVFVCKNFNDCQNIKTLSYSFNVPDNLLDKEIGLTKNQNSNDDPKKYFLLTFVESGLQQLNKFSNADIASISHKTDENGNICEYSFKAGFIEFSHSKKKN